MLFGSFFFSKLYKKVLFFFMFMVVEVRVVLIVFSLLNDRKESIVSNLYDVRYSMVRDRQLVVKGG